jgi:hypothetical protein
MFNSYKPNTNALKLQFSWSIVNSLSEHLKNNSQQIFNMLWLHSMVSDKSQTLSPKSRTTYFSDVLYYNILLGNLKANVFTEKLISGTEIWKVVPCGVGRRLTAKGHRRISLADRNALLIDTWSHGDCNLGKHPTTPTPFPTMLMPSAFWVCSMLTACASRTVP